MRTSVTHRRQPARLTLEPAKARRVVEAADLRALLAMVFHHTGDEYWISERFRPVRDARLIAPEDAGLPEDVQQEVRSKACAVLCDTAEPAVPEPTDDQLHRLMSFVLNQRVPAEYIPMMREQMGFASPLADVEPVEASACDILPVLIVGAGESGIALGAMLNDLGVEYRIVDRGATVGGTWRDTHYPGCAVDTPNHSYSYSFGKRFPWPRFFSEKREIQAYLEQCADEFDVRRHIMFDTECTGAEWDSAGQRWRVTVERAGERTELEARFFVTAIGPFGEPVVPRIPGLDSFGGRAMHSAHWPEGLDVSGKSVAILGTGASCMQIGPTIADSVSELTILQRTAQWARPIPRFHDRIESDVQVLLSDEPFYSGWYRFVMMWRYGDGLLATLRKDPSWPHPDRSLNSINDAHREEMTAHIRASLAGREDLIDKCIPDYPPYGKRILLDNGWYHMLLKPNVRLETGGVAQVEPTGVRLESGELIEADVLVLATGYDVSRNASQLDIRRGDGVTLADVWSDGTGAYLGIAVPTFPNAFVLQGPTTGLGHGGSAFFTSEAQARYVASVIAEALTSNIAEVDVKQERFDEYLQQVDEEHTRLVWTHPGMEPYYRNKFGKVRTVMPWRLVDYFHMTRKPTMEDFELTAPSSLAAGNA